MTDAPAQQFRTPVLGPDGKIPEEFWPDISSDVADRVAERIEVPDSATAVAVGAAATRTIRDTVFVTSTQIGLLGNGVASSATKNDAALQAFIDSLTERPGSFGATVRLHVTPGMYYFKKAFVFDKRITIVGSGRTNTVWRRTAGATGDFLTFNVPYSGIEGIALEGGRYQNADTLGMDNLVINSSYFIAKDLVTSKATGNGITIGKGATAIVVHLSTIQCRENRHHDIEAMPGGSTDGQWSHLDLAYSGKSSVVVGAGSQNVDDCHVFSAGLEDPTDNDGIVVASSGNIFVNAQSEKNLGRGAVILAGGNKFIGGSIWANVREGIYGANANNCTIVGVQVYRNCVGNSTGVSTTAFAAIRLLNTQRWRVQVDVWDNTLATTGSMPPTAPTYPYPGKREGLTHSYAVVEEGTTDYINYSGSTMSKIYTTGSSAGSPVVIVGHNASFEGCDILTAVQPAVPVAGVLRIPSFTEVVTVNAGTPVTNIVGHKVGKVRNVMVEFNGSGSQAIATSTTVKLQGGSFPAAPGAVLGLRSDGTTWFETFRYIP